MAAFSSLWETRLALKLVFIAERLAPAVGPSLSRTGSGSEVWFTFGRERQRLMAG
ncbi:hypothetical protein B4113_0951 [Geobacillus sp. B4113_201601]|nr:hypothetical protein B4113_0951 [Geobacillus sp. B4113_201601]